MSYRKKRKYDDSEEENDNNNNVYRIDNKIYLTGDIKTSSMEKCKRLIDDIKPNGFILENVCFFYFKYR